MPDGSHHADLTAAPSQASKSRHRNREASTAMNVVPLVGNPTGMLFRLRFIDEQLTAMDNDQSTGGRWSYEGRGLHREACALVDLAVEQTPTNMTDCIALIAAAYEKVGDVYREERTAEEMTERLEAPRDALQRVASFLAAEVGLQVNDFGGDWIFVGDRA